MSTMYETIMEFPLFKGVTHNMVSCFLEKTHVDFINLKEGEVIINEGEHCNKLRFIITGTAQMTIRGFDPDIEVTQAIGPKNVIGAEYLFGLSTSFPYSLTALTDISLLQFDKRQYEALLQTEPIYRINYYNYLSARAQRNPEWIKNLVTQGVIPFIGNILVLYTDQNSHNITIKIGYEDLCHAARLSTDEANLELQKLAEDNICHFEDGILNIPSRLAIIDRI